MHGLYTCEGHISRLQGLSSSFDTPQVTPGTLLHDTGLLLLRIYYLRTQIFHQARVERLRLTAFMSATGFHHRPFFFLQCSLSLQSCAKGLQEAIFLLWTQQVTQTLCMKCMSHMVGLGVGPQGGHLCQSMAWALCLKPRTNLAACHAPGL